MAGPIVVDLSQVVRLASNLSAAGPEIAAAIKPVMSKAGLEMKKKGAAEARGHKSAPALPAMWNYEVKGRANAITVEAGVRTGPKGTQFGPGGVAFYYYGNSKIGPSIPDPVHIVEEEATVAAQFLGTAASRAIRALG